MTQAIIPGCEENPDPKDVIIIDHTKPMKEINMNETKSNAMDNADIPESFKAFLATGSSVIETCRDLVHVTEIQKDEILRLREENERFRKENNDIKALMNEHQIPDVQELSFVFENYDGFLRLASDMGCKLNCDPDELRGKVEDLKKNNSSVPSDYQTLKDFKGEMDAIHDEFDIPHDVDALRNDLQEAKDIREVIESNTDVDFSVDTWAKDLQEKLDDYNAYKQACDNHMVEPDDLDSTLEEKDQLDNVLSDHDITDASELEDTLTDMEDAEAYEKGFNELAEFVEKIKEAIGHCGEDVPATDMEDYK